MLELIKDQQCNDTFSTTTPPLGLSECHMQLALSSVTLQGLCSPAAER